MTRDGMKRGGGLSVDKALEHIRHGNGAVLVPEHVHHATERSWRPSMSGKPRQRSGPSTRARPRRPAQPGQLEQEQVHHHAGVVPMPGRRRVTLPARTFGCLLASGQVVGNDVLYWPSL